MGISFQLFFAQTLRSPGFMEMSSTIRDGALDSMVNLKAVLIMGLQGLLQMEIPGFGLMDMVAYQLNSISG